MTILVHSTPSHFRLRDVIRKTWAGDVTTLQERAQVVFVVGRPSGEHPDLESALIKEANVNEDMLLLDIVDSYKNLTLKSILAFDWLLRTCDVTFAMKTDDDVYVNVTRLVTYLRDNVTVSQLAANATRFLIGRVIRDAVPLRRRTERYFTPEAVYKPSRYPPFLSGSAYVAPAATLRLIIDDVMRTCYVTRDASRCFWLEDVFLTGIEARKLDVTLLDHREFVISKSENRFWSRQSQGDFLSLHRVTSKELQLLHGKCSRSKQ